MTSACGAALSKDPASGTLTSANGVHTTHTPAAVEGAWAAQAARITHRVFSATVTAPGCEGLPIRALGALPTLNSTQAKAAASLPKAEATFGASTVAAGEVPCKVTAVADVRRGVVGGCCVKAITVTGSLLQNANRRVIGIVAISAVRARWAGVLAKAPTGSWRA